MLVGMSCLNSCMKTNCDCPVYPIAGKKVAEELSSVEQDLPNTFEWLGRINKMRMELQLQKGQL